MRFTDLEYWTQKIEAWLDLNKCTMHEVPHVRKKKMKVLFQVKCYLLAPGPSRGRIQWGKRLNCGPRSGLLSPLFLGWAPAGSWAYQRGERKKKTRKKIVDLYWKDKRYASQGVCGRWDGIGKIARRNKISEEWWLPVRRYHGLILWHLRSKFYSLVGVAAVHRVRARSVVHHAYMYTSGTEPNKKETKGRAIESGRGKSGSYACARKIEKEA